MILIALGANLPFRGSPPAETLRTALGTLADKSVKLVKMSGFYESPAWPDPSDPPFVNAVAEVETSKDPAALMHTLHEIESMFGRERGKTNAPRTLDLDLLDYEGHIQQGPPHLPHPRMSDRAFVLLPLKDIAPDWRHPISGQTIGELLSLLDVSALQSTGKF